MFIYQSGIFFHMWPSKTWAVTLKRFRNPGLVFEVVFLASCRHCDFAVAKRGHLGRKLEQMLYKQFAKFSCSCFSSGSFSLPPLPFPFPSPLIGWCTWAGNRTRSRKGYTWSWSLLLSSYVQVVLRLAKFMIEFKWCYIWNKIVTAFVERFIQLVAFVI